MTFLIFLLRAITKKGKESRYLKKSTSNTNMSGYLRNITLASASADVKQNTLARNQENPKQLLVSSSSVYEDIGGPFGWIDSISLFKRFSFRMTLFVGV